MYTKQQFFHMRMVSNFPSWHNILIKTIFHSQVLLKETITYNSSQLSRTGIRFLWDTPKHYDQGAGWESLGLPFPTHDRSLQMILGTQNNWDFCVMDDVITDTSKNCAPYEPGATAAQHNQHGFLSQSRFTYLLSWLAFLDPELHWNLQTRECSSC